MLGLTRKLKTDCFPLILTLVAFYVTLKEEYENEFKIRVLLRKYFHTSVKLFLYIYFRAYSNTNFTLFFFLFYLIGFLLARFNWKILLKLRDLPF